MNGMPLETQVSGNYLNLMYFLRGTAKKSSFLSGRATKRGGGLNGFATKKKITFYKCKQKVPMATKPRGGGG